MPGGTKINLCSYFVGSSLPPPLTAHPQKKNVTFSKTRPGYRHAKLVSTLGLTQCQTPRPPSKILATPLFLNLNMILRNSAQKLKKASLTFDKLNELEK